MVKDLYEEPIINSSDLFINKNLFMGVKISLKNCAFVASTLPIYQLNRNINKWQIKEIYLASKDLDNSYNYLAKNFPNVKMTIIPSGRYQQLIFLVWKVIQIKFSSKKIYFFHECCWVLFDLIIYIFKPKGEYFPQVTMSGNPIQTKGYVFESLWLKIITLNWFNSFFNCHRRINSDSYCFSIKSYPSSITINTITRRLSRNNLSIENKILFIVGNEFREKNMNMILVKIINLMLENEYIVKIKDHPRPSERLGVKKYLPNLLDNELDPNIPIELIQDNFLSVLGLYSTSLLFFGKRSISLINLIQKENKDDLFYHKKHLVNMPGGDDIFFPDSTEEIIDYLKIIKK